MAAFFRATTHCHVTVTSIGSPLLHLQRSFSRQVGVLVARLILRIARSQDVRYLVPYNYKMRKVNVVECLIQAAKSSWSQFQNNFFIGVEPREGHKSKSIFSTLATTFGTVEFQTKKHPLRVLSLNLAYELAYKKTKVTIRDVEPCLVVTGNGRLVKPAAIVAAARDHGISVRIVERGAFPGTFDLYTTSPHSIKERRDRAEGLYRDFGSKEAELISKQYIELRREFDPISGLAWHRSFTPGKLPALDERKICVCYSSTETEFAVFGDILPAEEFQTQAQAFRSLAEILDPDEWQVIIRRHPYGERILHQDPEQKLWWELQNLSHVTIVSPNDSIDSYALVKAANLVAHFNSSMGPEAISMEACPVITMGPTLWEKSDSPYLINTKEKLLSFSASELNTRDKSDIYLWGLYWATFGYKFKIVEWLDSKGYVDDKKIL